MVKIYKRGNMLGIWKFSKSNASLDISQQMFYSFNSTAPCARRLAILDHYTNATFMSKFLQFRSCGIYGRFDLHSLYSIEVLLKFPTKNEFKEFFSSRIKTWLFIVGNAVALNPQWSYTFLSITFSESVQKYYFLGLTKKITVFKFTETKTPGKY